MATYYDIHPKFHVAVDCIIFGFNKDGLSLLLLKRNMEPFFGAWSLMGGFVQNDESVDNAAKRVLREYTGLNEVYMEQVGTFGAVHREPEERAISVAYYALINIQDYDKKCVEEHNGYWARIDELPHLLFDHEEMIEKAREQMRRKASSAPISFNLLPELFTLTQLQSLYEAIYDCPIDKRNFRKKVADMDFIEQTELIDKKSSRRGARLYRFNNHIYSKSLKFKL